MRSIALEPPSELGLASGATGRMRGPFDGRVAILLGGGVSASLPGIWNASLEWLADELEPRHPELGMLELRYRVRSWRQLGSCVEDGVAAIDAAVAAGARELVLIGFSMGGAVAVSIAGHPLVDQVIGLAPWLSDRLELSPLRGRRLDVLHGSLDRWFPGVPGVPASLSQRSAERARALGVPVSYHLVRGGVHGIAARTRFGLVRYPRAHEWLERVDQVLSNEHAGLRAARVGS